MNNESFIVGDAGGTSTEWRVVNDGEIAQFETIGFNAYTHSVEDFRTDIIRIFGAQIEKEVPVYLYAAGVDTNEQSVDVREKLKDVFGENLYVENDLLGVARSLCGKRSGNVCILGTGANACLYDGQKVDKVGSSLGYVLGDEGSGAYLGKKLLVNVFRKRFSQKVCDIFEEEFSLTAHSSIQKIYNEPKPNHFLASFATFIFSLRKEREIYDMVYRSFEDFFDAFFGEQVASKDPFYFAGSIAWYFSDILRDVGNSRGIEIKKIAQSPVAGLVLYHQKYG